MGHYKHIISRNNTLAWDVVGDFNVVRNCNKRKGLGNARVNRAELDNFNTFIYRCQLFDISAIGRKFTWYRPNDTTRSRLDRILVLDSWMGLWPGSTQYIQSR